MGQLMYSFIIPVYKCEKYLEECISSIQAQDLDENYEIILVNDGSPDGSPTICNKYAEKYEYIHAFHKENGGVSSARNYGIEKAKGQYLLFIDGDDTLDQRLITSIKESNITEDTLFIYGMSFDYYNQETIERIEVYAYPEEGMLGMDELSESFNKFFQCNSLSSACNKVFSREIIEKYHLRFDEDMNLYEDFDFVLRYLKYVKEIYCVKEGYYHYRLQKNNSHLKARVSDLNRLMTNLDKVGRSIESLGKSQGNVKLGVDTYKNLYLQLLYLHLLYTEDISFSTQSIVKKFHEDDKLKNRLECEGQPGANEAVLLQYLMENKADEIKRWMRKKRLRMNIKNILRPFVNVIRKAVK